MKSVVLFFTKLCEAYLPDAFVFCLLLTAFVFSCAWGLTPYSSWDLLDFWARDFWSLNAFSMQMTLILLTGHIVAKAPVVKKVIDVVSNKIKTETTALVVICLFSLFMCWIHWGMGLILSAVLAIEVARKLEKVNFGLFVASAYSGFLVWHGGLSGTIPLKMAGQDEILTKIYPNLSLSLNETIFSSFNLMIIFLLALTLPLVILWMRTERKDTLLWNDEKHDEILKNFTTPKDLLENRPWVNRILFLGLILVIMREMKKFDINLVNLIFLSLGILFHHTPRKFLEALNSSLGICGGIILQFPFYAGLMGLMQNSGLADQIAHFFVSISTVSTLPLLTFLSAGMVNFFIPSGGGQWVVQGPIMLKACRELGADPAKISMALAWGDAWTNMIQPFWALPLLGAARLELKDIMGYCLVITLVSGVVISFIFLVF